MALGAESIIWDKKQQAMTVLMEPPWHLAESAHLKPTQVRKRQLCLFLSLFGCWPKPILFLITGVSILLLWSPLPCHVTACPKCVWPQCQLWFFFSSPLHSPPGSCWDLELAYPGSFLFCFFNKTVLELKTKKATKCSWLSGYTIERPVSRKLEEKTDRCLPTS